MPHRPRSDRFACRARLAAVLVGMGVALAALIGFEFWRGSTIRWSRLAISLCLAALPYWFLIGVARFTSPHRANRQFSLKTMLFAATYICVLIALVRFDVTAHQNELTGWKRIESNLQRIIGSGTVRVGTESLLQVDRPTFSDHDLQRIIAIHPLMIQHGCPITVLDVAGTKLTNDGIRQIAKLSALEFCFLDGTAVTDITLRRLVDHLPRLQVISCDNTRVTDQTLLELSRKRPRLTIEPKSYLQLTQDAEMPPSTLIIDPD